MKYLFILLFPILSFAEESRWIDLEWEPVQEAREYEIQLFQQVGAKAVARGKYKTENPEWSHAVIPGKYFLRLRSMDKRGVPGEWSEDIPLKVRMQNPVLLRPSSLEKVAQGMINFEWAAVNEAYQYQLIVRKNNKSVLHNATLRDVRSSVYIENLGEIQWVVLALEKGEEQRSPEDISDTAFRKFVRVGGVLEAPTVDLQIKEKISFSWSKVRSAELYEIDYLPPPDSGEKSRRFKLKQSPLVFSPAKLKEGVTTLTVKAIAPGHQESLKSVVKVSKSGNDVELEDIIQGKAVEETKISPTQSFFPSELYMAVTLSQFAYESENSKTDTKLDQDDLTGLGLMLEWNRRPTLSALNRKLEASLLNLSSGIDSGMAIRGAYTYNKEKKWKSKRFSFGAGASFLSLPTFMGDRAVNKVSVETSSSVGPEFVIGFINPIHSHWELQTALNLAYHPLYISSRAKGDKAYMWMKGYLRVQRYYTEKQSFFAQLDYQAWSQSWSQDKSDLSGISVNFGIKSGF